MSAPQTRGRCVRCGEHPPHVKSKKGLCAVCLGASRDAWRAKIRQQRIEAAGRRDEAESILAAAEEASSVTDAEAVATPATVWIKPATSSFAHHARQWRAFERCPEGGIQRQLASGRQAVAYAGVLAHHGIGARVVIELAAVGGEA